MSNNNNTTISSNSLFCEIKLKDNIILLIPVYGIVLIIGAIIFAEFSKTYIIKDEVKKIVNDNNTTNEEKIKKIDELQGGYYVWFLLTIIFVSLPIWFFGNFKKIYCGLKK
jgi:hypothetical protein